MSEKRGKAALVQGNTDEVGRYARAPYLSVSLSHLKSRYVYRKVLAFKSAFNKLVVPSMVLS